MTCTVQLSMSYKLQLPKDVVPLVPLAISSITELTLLPTFVPILGQALCLTHYFPSCRAV
jgi:hypothetical protein